MPPAPSPNTAAVVDQHGRRGSVDASAFAGAISEGTDTVQVETPDGRVLSVARQRLSHRPDGTYLFAGSFDEAADGHLDHEETHRLALGRETLHVERETHDTARVRISTEVHEDETVVREPVLHETVEVDRVPVDRVVDGPVEVRQEGDVTIIPILEERLVVQKQLVLKEELHVRMRRTQQVDEQRVLLRRTEASVERDALSPGAAPPDRPPPDSP